MDDSMIVGLYWKRDENAITESDRKYGRYCASIAMNIVNDHDHAEECVNDTWLNAWNSIPPASGFRAEEQPVLRGAVPGHRRGLSPQ